LADTVQTEFANFEERNKFGLEAPEDEIEDLDDELFKTGLRLIVDTEKTN